MPLVQRQSNGINRRSNGYRSNGHSTNGTANSNLPPYEPVQHPLSQDAIDELRALARTHDGGKYDHHLRESIKALSTVVAPINELLYEQRDYLVARTAGRKNKMRETGEEIPPTEREVALEERVAKLEDRVPDLTRQVEHRLRQVIDLQAEKQGEADALTAAVSEAITLAEEARARERLDEEQLAQAEELDVTGPNERYKTLRIEKGGEYAQQSAFDKYGAHNDYAAFRKLVHDAQVPDGKKPVPHATRWFDEDGEPINLVYGEEGDRDAEDSDGDVVVEAVKKDFRCPLIQKVMSDPVTSTKCPHSFQKEAIFELIRTNGGRIQCPIPGCDMAMTKDDFREDPALLRQIQRAKRQEDEDDSDEDTYMGGTPANSNQRGE